jgi:hypothetical protein
LLAEPVAIGPGSSLELQTSQGPMTLTVDSPMNQAGYVHAYGFKNGIEYAGFVKLMSSESSDLQGEPEYTPAQTTSQPYISAAKNVLTLSIGRDGSATLNGEPVIASNTRTASVLRLLAKKAVPKIGFAPATPIDSEIVRAKALLNHLEAEKRARLSVMQGSRSTMLALDDDSGTSAIAGRKFSRRQGGSESNQAMYAAMQSLMRSVAKI